MTLRLLDSDWGCLLEKCLRANSSDVCLMTPFIKRRPGERLLEARFPRRLRVITRFALGGFASGVSDISTLQWLLDNGAEVRGVKNLHAKLYVFGSKRAVVTSANLTQAALTRNHEFGFLSDEAKIVKECRAYFDTL